MKLEQFEQVRLLVKLLEELQGLHDDVAGLGQMHVSVRGQWREELEKVLTPVAVKFYKDRIETVKRELRVLGVEVE